MVRSSLVRVLQRLPAGVTAPETYQAFRAAFSSSALSTENSLLNGLQGKKSQHEGFKGFPQFQHQGLGFAAQMHSLSSEEESKKEPALAATASSAPEAKHVARVPTALTLLPARPAMRGAAAPAQRMAQAMAMSTAAAGLHDAHDDHGEHSADHARVHPFHVLPPSWWPLLGAYGAFISTLGMTLWFHAYPHGTALMLTGVASTMLTATAWWRDCIIESDMGMHTEVVKKNLVSGMWLFIASEAMLFVGLLWTCIHYGMAPNVHVQMQWPPVGVVPVGWDKRALVMSAVLAASYYSANVAMVAKDQKTSMAALGATIGLGALFLADQYLEYTSLPFTITDSPYGSTFYITTGFHGMHVLLGAIYLSVCLAMYPRVKAPGVGMKTAVLYWHFVDIVWIAVYGIIYAGGY